MLPYVASDDFTVYVGDVRAVLAELDGDSVDCVVTSPPYWGLRDYNDPGQLGLEETPEAYVENLVAVFAELRRVLADHGTVWLNLGDSYAGGQSPKSESEPLTAGAELGSSYRDNRPVAPSGLKSKDLVGIPWRVAFALQANGWYLRSDIIWSKPNPMPESMTDRPTKSHEYVFLFAKSPTYFFDQEAVREPFASRPQQRLTSTADQPKGHARAKAGVQNPLSQGGTHAPLPVPQIETLDGIAGEAARGADGRRVTTVKGANGSIQPRDGERWPNAGGRNIRTVWDIATTQYLGAHFAVYPEKLVEPCVLAGCPERVCRTCGKPATRIVNGTETVGWSDCGHDDWRRGVVLDPFGGSGTTAYVTRKHGRAAVAIELNPEYAELLVARNAQQSLLFEEGVE